MPDGLDVRRVALAAGRDPGRPGARRLPRPRGRLLVRGAPPGRERGGRARDLCRARRAAAGGAGRGDVLALALAGARAAGRRSADQRRVELEPGRAARRARAICASARTAAGRSRSSATWPSSAPTPPASTRRPDARRPGSTSCSGSASSPATSDPDEWVATAAEAVERARAARPARRRRPRQGLALGRARDRRRRARGGGAAVTRVLIAALVALIISLVVGPKFIEFLRRNEFGQHIREEGPQHHLAKQGTPTMGGLMILFAATIAFLLGQPLPAPVADRALHDARLRRDRVPRRLREADAQALARPLGALEDAAARRRDRRRRGRRVAPPPEHEPLHPGASTRGCRSRTPGTRSSSSSSRAPRTGRTSRTASTGSPAAPGSSRCSRSWR